MQPALAATLRAAAMIDERAAPSAAEPWFWDVRAGALFGAISTAYRRWAATPGSELSELVATAIEVVLPILTPGHVARAQPVDLPRGRNHFRITFN